LRSVFSEASDALDEAELDEPPEPIPNGSLLGSDGGSERGDLSYRGIRLSVGSTN
jgi:hypothetical protein